MDDLLADFLTETHEGLDALDAALVHLETTPEDRPTVSEIFRLVHTIKGTCGFLGLVRLERVAHAAENVLGRYRDGSLAVTPPGISLVLAALDRIRRIVEGIGAGGGEPVGDDTTLIAALDAAFAEASKPGAAGAESGVASESEGSAPRGGIHARASTPALGAAESANAAAEAASTPSLPDEARSDGAEKARGVSGAAGAAPQTIRVAVEVLGELMTLVGELVLTRNQLMQLARGGADNAFTAPLQRLSHITTELQESVMTTRLQPIGHAWAKLPRLARDLAQELGKQIELDLKGADTELDRQVLELIKDPLTHMVRNSADHGLETPAERRAAGKADAGRISLDAHHRDGHIIIEVSDDGRGLSLDRIREKAIGQGLASKAELAGMAESEIHRFVFRAGFSTATAISSVSGRGVGMDVVKTNIERLGGTIELRSREGRGTTFIIKIPLTLAIVSALVVEAGGERFAMPQMGVVELVLLGGDAQQACQIEWVNDTPVLRLRDRLLPLVRLATLLQLDCPKSTSGLGPFAPGGSGFVIVTQVGPCVFGVVVDRVFDTEEIVVKPVAPILRHVTVFSGNAILGDGSVIMILDPNGIARTIGVDSDGVREKHGTAAVATGLHSAARTAMLLFRAGDATPKAVPLGLIARLEEFAADQIECTGGRPVVQYRGRLMPLAAVSGAWAPGVTGARQPVLVFSERDHLLGLMVDEILDVVEEPLAIEARRDDPGFLGSAVIAGKVTAVLDSGFWLRHAGEDWFGPDLTGTPRVRLLLVEDNAFFRHLLVPTLSAEGYDVTAVADAVIALRLRDDGQRFDAVISDIEMPGMDGLRFAAAVREAGPWQELPMIALSGRSGPADRERGLAAGFTDYVRKFDRAAILRSLTACLPSTGPVRLAG